MPGLVQGSGAIGSDQVRHGGGGYPKAPERKERMGPAERQVQCQKLVGRKAGTGLEASCHRGVRDENSLWSDHMAGSDPFQRGLTLNTATRSFSDPSKALAGVAVAGV